MQQTYVCPSDKAWIKCLICSRTSHNHNDVRERYCSHCHIFHDDIAKVRELECAKKL